MHESTFFAIALPCYNSVFISTNQNKMDIHTINIKKLKWIHIIYVYHINSLSKKHPKGTSLYFFLETQDLLKLIILHNKKLCLGATQQLVFNKCPL